MKLTVDSGVGLTPELLIGTSRAVNGHAAEVAASAVRESLLVLRLSSYRDGATPVICIYRIRVMAEPDSFSYFADPRSWGLWRLGVCAASVTAYFTEIVYRKRTLCLLEVQTRIP